MALEKDASSTAVVPSWGYHGKLERISGEGLQAKLAGSYAGFGVAGQAPLENIPRRDSERGKGGTTRGFGSVRESVAMFGFGPGVSGMNSSGFKPTIPVLNGKQESLSRWKQESEICSRQYGFDAVFTRADECQDVNVGDPN